MAAGTQMGEKESDQTHDTEITLSTGKLLGIFFALAIVCGVFFTMGYLLGKSTSAGGRTEIVATVPSGRPQANRMPAIRPPRQLRKSALPVRPTAGRPQVVPQIQAQPVRPLINRLRANLRATRRPINPLRLPALT